MRIGSCRYVICTKWKINEKSLFSLCLSPATQPTSHFVCVCLWKVFVITVISSCYFRLHYHLIFVVLFCVWLCIDRVNSRWLTCEKAGILPFKLKIAIYQRHWTTYTCLWSQSKSTVSMGDFGGLIFYPFRGLHWEIFHCIHFATWANEYSVNQCNKNLSRNSLNEPSVLAFSEIPK